MDNLPNGAKGVIIVIAMLLVFLFAVDGVRSLVLVITGKDDATAVTITNFVITTVSGIGGGSILAYVYSASKGSEKGDK